MERLTPEDTAFLRLESEISAMHSVSIAILDGPEPDFDLLRDRLDERVGFVPRFRQRVVEVPFGLERPVWINNPQFMLDYHVRHTGLPSPDGAALANLVSRILSQRLDRGKPLWELWMVSGLADGRWAIISKAHHAMIDGVSGVDPLALVVDEFVPSSATPPPWEPDPLPSDRELLDRAALDMLTKPSEQWRAARHASRLPGRLLKAAGALAGQPAVPHRGPNRRWSTVLVPFEEVRERRLAAETTTNDVLMTYVAMGLRALAPAGPPWSGQEITALLPYAVGPGGFFTNEISSLAVQLPLGDSSFSRTLKSVSAELAPATPRAHRVPASSMTNQRGLAAPTVAALGIRRVTRDTSGRADTVAVNAPGPREPLTVLGQPMASLASATPLAAGVPISFGILSYVDHFTISVTTDLDSGLDPSAVTEAVKRVAFAD